VKKPGAVSRPGANRQFQFHEYVDSGHCVNIAAPFYFQVTDPSRRERPLADRWKRGDNAEGLLGHERRVGYWFPCDFGASHTNKTVRIAQEEQSSASGGLPAEYNSRRPDVGSSVNYRRGAVCRFIVPIVAGLPGSPR
jgi:hypothetical protein